MVLGFAGHSKTVFRVWDFVKQKVFTASNLTFREDIKAYPNFAQTPVIPGVNTHPDLFGGFYDNFDDIPPVELGLHAASKGISYSS